MNTDFETLVCRLIGTGDNTRSLSTIEVGDSFDPDASGRVSVARSLNAAFLMALSGNGHPLAGQARDFLNSVNDRDDMGRLASFLRDGLELMEREVDGVITRDPDWGERLARVRAGLERHSSSDEDLRLVWQILFPEGLGCLDDRARSVKDLCQRRGVRVSSVHPDPVTDPAGEVLFTANALLTLPHPGSDFDPPDMDAGFRKRLEEVAASGQRYWYDHPIPLGIDLDRNEVVYGLRGLASMLAHETDRRPEIKGRKLACLLSVSVTHDGLQELGREYLTRIVGRVDGLEGLEIHVFTEDETSRLKNEILFPAAKYYFPEKDITALDEIFGVDGEYGRHYSFLKAAAAWWRVMIDGRVKATFKIDLDQVFPGPELVAQTGASVFEHLSTPLWGAKGRDSAGQEIELGLLAGALVNQSDFDRGLFTPDVPWPDRKPAGDETVFFSALPQALSTEAEMMTRYDGDPDGLTTCLQRVHVTGGTTGALVESLRRHRPFTPTFIGRAEDQAYLLSVLFERSPRLRYLHQAGLIMRHDKAQLIPEAIAQAQLGKTIGDYIRILWFSYYARALPWPLEDIKAAIDPFTGCFVSRLPVCLVYLRLTLKAAALFAQKQTDSDTHAVDLLEQGSRRLGDILRIIEDDGALTGPYQREKEGWNLYYDLLDCIETGLKENDPFALELGKRAWKLKNDSRI